MVIRKKRFSSTQTVLVLVGGHAQRLLPFIRILFPEVTHVIVIDALDELNRLGSSARSVNVQLFALGVGHTAQTLTIDLPEDVQKYLASVGGMEASRGLGQAIAVGDQAGELLAASAAFLEFVRRVLLPKVRSRSGGALEALRLVFIGSIAGATFAGAALPIARALTRQCLDLTSATVSVEFLVTGGLTYEGLGDRIWPNSGSALTELVAYVTDPLRNKREIRRIRCLEFEVLGLDEALRDAYLAQVEQAAHCEWLRLDSQRRSPNDALNGRLGNAQTWELAFGRALDPSRDIAAVANDSYGAPIRDALNRKPQAAAAEALELEHQRIRLDNLSVDALTEGAADHIAERVIAELRAPTYRHDVQVYVRRSANQRDNLKAFQSLWAVAPKTLHECDCRLQLQGRLLELLQSEKRDLATRRQGIEAAIAIEETKFRRIHRSQNPTGVKEHFQSAWTSTASKDAKLYRAAIRIRELSDELVEVTAEEVALDKAFAIVKRVYDYLRAKLTRIVDALTKAGPPLGNDSETVTLYSLDERLPELWDSVDEGETEFLDALKRSVQYATIDGLAKICGAEAREVEDIAKKIWSTHAYETPSVAWGGRRRADQGRTVHVLPPLAPDDQRLLIEAMSRLNSEAIIAFADTSPVVVNVVAVTMRLVRELSDVLTEPYILGLKEAVNSGCVPLFLREELRSLHSLGIKVIDGEIVLPS